MIAYENDCASPELLRLQAIQRQMLADFAAFCEAHGLTWFLVAGSALGALRHGNVIPWDDDIDIGMLRDDFERAAHLLGNGAMAGYFWQSRHRTPEYHYGFAKLRRTGTSTGEPDFAAASLPDGIFMDIFPYDRLPKSGFARRLQRIALGALNQIIQSPHHDASQHFGRPRRMARSVGLVLRRERALPIFSWLRDWIQRRGASDDIESFGLFGIAQWRRTAMRMDEVIPPAQLPFGDTMANVPANCERHCEKMYGDWRRLPPTEARQPSHMGLVDFGDL